MESIKILKIDPAIWRVSPENPGTESGLGFQVVNCDNVRSTAKHNR